MIEKDFIPIEEARRNRLIAPNPDYKPPRVHTVAPPTLQGKAIPTREWLWRDFIPHGAVSMIAGDGGLGKTLLAMQLLAAVSTGKDLFGIETRKCRAIGVFAEDDAAELQRRQAAINSSMGLDFADLESLLWVPRVGEENALVYYGAGLEKGQRDLTEFAFSLHREIENFGAELLVLDSLYNFFPGNENDRSQVDFFMRNLKAWCRDNGLTVVICSHPSRSGKNDGSGESGSTGWKASVRSQLYLTKPRTGDDDQDDDARELNATKANYSALGSLKLRYADGVFTRADAPRFGMVDSLYTEAAFLACLDSYTAQGRRVTDTKFGNYAPKLFAKMDAAKDCTEAQLRAAMERLFQSGKIKMGVIRTDDRKTKPAIVRVS